MPKFHDLVIDEVRKETDDCVSLLFQVPSDLKDEFNFIQGQYLTLRTTINGEDVRRSYSFCSGVDEGELRVAIKKVPNGVFSTYANDVLKAGDSLRVMKPMGRFYTPLDKSNEKHYVGVAAGSGITPILSIIKSVLSNEPESTFTLFYGNQKSSTVIFKEEIEDIKDTSLSRFRVFHLLTREPSEVPILSGRITEEKVTELTTKLLNDRQIDEVFMCGPAEMIEGATASFEKSGIPKEKLHFELFTSPLAPKPVAIANEMGPQVR